MSGDQATVDSHTGRVALIAGVLKRCDQVLNVTHLRRVASRPATLGVTSITHLPDGGSPR